MAERELVVLDTDVLIDHLRGARDLAALPWGRWAYSMLSRMELFAGRDEEAVLRDLLGRGTELGMTRSIAERAGVVKRSCGLAAPDAFIAATALVHDLVLVTRNRKHFEGIPNLVVRSPGG